MLDVGNVFSEYPQTNPRRSAKNALYQTPVQGEFAAEAGPSAGRERGGEGERSARRLCGGASR